MKRDPALETHAKVARVMRLSQSTVRDSERKAIAAFKRELARRGIRPQDLLGQ